MSDFRKLSESVWASPQITADDVAEAAQQGITLVINNRPDGEDDGQPEGARIEAAAREHGLSYVAIPIDHSGFSQPQVKAMADALEGADGKVLAYCRSGTRSTFLWSMAEASRGEEPAALIEAARGAGYDISPVSAMLEMLAARSDG